MQIFLCRLLKSKTIWLKFCISKGAWHLKSGVRALALTGTVRFYVSVLMARAGTRTFVHSLLWANISMIGGVWSAGMCGTQLERTPYWRVSKVIYLGSDNIEMNIDEISKEPKRRRTTFLPSAMCRENGGQMTLRHIEYESALRCIQWDSNQKKNLTAHWTDSVEFKHRHHHESHTGKYKHKHEHTYDAKSMGYYLQVWNSLCSPFRLDFHIT